MHTWVYYLDESPSAAFILYRVMEDLSDPIRRFRKDPQVYHRQKGWIADEDFIEKMNKTGFVSSEDVISEKQALELMAKI